MLQQILFFVLGCSDKGVTINNSTPEIIITSHNDGDTVFTSEEIEFRATATDNNNNFGELEVEWRVGERVACPFTIPDMNGYSSCLITLEEGEDNITATVRDPDNATGIDDVSLNLVVSNAPTASIIQPLSSSVYYSDVLITFEGVIADDEDIVTDLFAFWESSVDGELDLNTAPESDGNIIDFGYLTPGEHGITLRVEDSSGKTSSDSVTITVKESNSSPECEIVAPPTGSSGVEGQLVIFEGQVSDPDIPASSLNVAWASDKDGALGDSTPNSSGGVSFPFSDLSVDTHVVSMTVTDEIGATCVADMIYTVGSPPIITLTSPAEGDQFNEGDTISFVAEISDNEDSASQISVSWTSSIDGTFSNTGPNSNGVAQFTTDSLTPGEQSITVTAIDSTGLYTDAIVNININGIPTAPDVEISPEPAYTTDDLVATASGSIDPDGSTVSYSYEWYLNASLTTLTGSTLSANNTAKGELWTVRVTPSDGTSDGPYTEASTVIANTSPELLSVSISPASPSTQDTLTCSYSANDEDGDTVSGIYAWYSGGNTLSSTSDTLEGPFAQGDQITCRVTPNDGTDNGDYMEATVTISNGSPTISSVSLTPSSVYTNDIVTATVSASDPDGDPLTYTWRWYVDSGNGAALVVTNSGSGISDTLDGVFHFDKDDSVYVEVDAADSSASDTMTSSSITILNTPPTAFNVLIAPASPVAGLDDLVCTPQDADADGDSVSLSYAWEVDGVSTTYSTDTIPASDTADGEVWECIITPNDGTDDGSTASATVTIGANAEGATGIAFCASAGEMSDGSGNESVHCLSEVGVAGSESTDGASNVWQPGSIFVFSPE